MSLITKISFIESKELASLILAEDLNLHDQLTDNADWNAEFWEFDIEFLAEYATRLSYYYDCSIKGIEFQAMWVSDRPNVTRNLSIDELLEVVRSNRIGTRTRYLIRKLKT